MLLFAFLCHYQMQKSGQLHALAALTQEILLSTNLLGGWAGKPIGSF